LATDAELAVVNFYGKITDVSPEIALQVIAILESTLLAIIIFWVINKCDTYQNFLLQQLQHFF
jgi:hypothetical protein